MKRILNCIIALVCLLTACAIPHETPTDIQGPSVFAHEDTETHKVISEQNTQDSSVSAPEETEEYEVVPEGTSPDEFADYDSIIEEYRRFASYAIEFDDEYYSQVDALDLWMSRGWMGWIIAVNYYTSQRTKEDFSYAIQDLNGTSNPELILFLEDSIVCAIFSMVDFKPKLLDYFWDKHRCEIDSTGTLYVRSTSGADYNTFASYRISQNDNELVLIDEFGTNGYDMDTLETLYYKMVDGINRSINEKEFDELYLQFLNVPYLTKDSEIILIPLFDG